MSLQKAQITVHPPLTQKKLTRYHKKEGTFIIRDNQAKVLYIGRSTDLYNTICRLFQNKGVLQKYDSRKMHFEIIVTHLRTARIKSILQRYFRPVYNKRIQPVAHLNERQRWRAGKILEGYLQQSRFVSLEEVKGEHKTDSISSPKN